MKKKLLIFVFVLCAFSGTVWANQEGKDECKMPPPYAGSAELQKVKSLAGEWEAENPMSPENPMHLVYEVTSNGSAVVERMNPGTPQEMVSVYYDEKGKLAMTHYCALANQPKLALVSASGNQMKLEFAKQNVINPKKEDHMHGLVLTFVGPDEIKQEWSGFQGGKPMPAMALTLKRVKQASDNSTQS